MWKIFLTPFNESMKMTKNFGTNVLLAAALLCVALNTLSAQPVLNFKRVTVNWPTIELYISPRCNGKLKYDLNKSDFSIQEDGREIQDFTVWCPDPVVRCALSATLVLDCSARMEFDTTLQTLKNGAHAFVKYMDGVTDQAEILSFDSTVHINSDMTELKSTLDTAIDSVRGGGPAKLWDGLYTAISELIANGTNQCRAVLLFSNGFDNGSARTQAEVIALANRYRIRVFTLGYGYDVDAAFLESVALQTGGQFYLWPSKGELSKVYQEITAIMIGIFGECVLTYQASCMDGTSRKVLVTLNTCGGTSAQTKTYRAPRDTTTFAPVRFTLGKVWSKADMDVVVPLNIAMNLNDDLAPFSFAVNFDRSCVTFQSISTPSGAYLEGNPIILTPTSSGVTVSVKNLTHIADSGTLALFTFHTSDPYKDTVCCPIVFSNWYFNTGCFRPVTENGEVCILPRSPKVSCSLEAPSALSWQAGRDYDPCPVSVMLTNSGERTAMNPRYTIRFDASDFSLISPLSATQDTKDVLPGESVTATWLLLPKERSSGELSALNVTAIFDNQRDVSCTTDIWISSADSAALFCNLSVDPIHFDTATGQFLPFSVRLELKNDTPGDTTLTTILLPPELVLAPPDAPDHFTKPAPFGSYPTWMVSAPSPRSADFGRKYPIAVSIRSKGGDSSRCSTFAFNEDLALGIVQPRCFAPDSLHFNPATGSFEPNPFTVRVTAVNTGSSRMLNTTTTVYPTANAQLGAGETETKDLGTLNPYKPGDVVPEASWQVLHDPAAPKQRSMEFLFRVRSTNIIGETDSADVYCSVEIPYNLLDVDHHTESSGIEFSLECYPVPFTAQAQFSFTLPRAEDVSLDVFDAFGRCVQTLAKAGFTAGAHSVTFHPGDIPSGVYFIRLGIHGRTVVKEIQYLR
jgi:hypothetical protein